jgi:hypothetical protein
MLEKVEVPIMIVHCDESVPVSDTQLQDYFYVVTIFTIVYHGVAIVRPIVSFVVFAFGRKYMHCFPGIFVQAETIISPVPAVPDVV